MSQDSSEPEISVEDVLHIAQSNRKRINELEEEKEKLQRQLRKVEKQATKAKLRLSELNDETDYDSLSIEQKVGRVREHAFVQAADHGGPFTITYRDVIYGAFSGEPGAKHAYKLMRLAGDAPGFEYHDEPRSSEKPKRLECKPEIAKTDESVLAGNKAVQEGEC